ncbi:hypothetical protein GCM10011401_17130 [Nesterenkonia cremea]|uniref:Uncharacterized protein n=1 Tax=Nesterenkonia cremea TaxID=1882340 RepID=A0A917EQ84_9MICC|nr:hypothetical protein GCM10011401_17130 [Nesterenkonia cremea]
MVERWNGMEATVPSSSVELAMKPSSKLSNHSRSSTISPMGAISPESSRERTSVESSTVTAGVLPAWAADCTEARVCS